MSENKFLMKKSTSLVCLVIISLISLILKLIFIDFSIPVTSDNLDYLLMSISYLNGDFSQSVHRAGGWPLFVSMFYQIAQPEEFQDFSNLIRILAMSISIATIALMYKVGRKFFSERYSLVCAGLIAFEPHLNFNSSFGLSEPIFIFTVLLAFYFILNKNSKFIIPSLCVGAFAWWIKIDGFFILFIITIIYFITYRKKENVLRNYLIGLLICIIVLSPMLMQKQEQFGNPFYSYYSDVMFAGNYEKLLSENTKHENNTAFDYIEKNGVFEFVYNFILKGFYNIFNLFSKIAYPYLFILIPFGIIFSFRAFDQDSQYVKANWIFLIVAVLSMVITIAIVPERRYLFYLFPFLIIFSVIPIQRVTEYGLSTFSFSQKQRNVFIIIVIGLALLLSLYFSLNVYDKTSSELENEKFLLSKYIIDNLDGKILRDFNVSTEYMNYYYLTRNNNFNEYTISQGMNFFKDESEKKNVIFLSANSTEELVNVGKKFGLKYFIVYKDNNVFHDFLDELYENEHKYSYLKKIFDSNNEKFNLIKVKIFEIDYKEFDKLKNKNL